MKVLLVNGSGHVEGCTYTALEEVAAALEKNGIEVISGVMKEECDSLDASAAVPA